MVTRWFGPRPIQSGAIERHGACGCCGCGGLDVDDNFVRYPAYRDGLRMKLVIEDVPDSFAVDFNGIIFTEASGMAQYNGTWYLDIIKSQYGCIWDATDEETFDVEYRMYDPGFGYDLNYTQRVCIRSNVVRSSTNVFLARLESIIAHFSPDYNANVILSGLPYGTNIHPMIGVSFQPTDSSYRLADGLVTAPDSVTLEEQRAVLWDAARLEDVISGDLKFYLSRFADQDPMSPDFTNAAWSGIGTFFDTGTADFKIAGTFTAEIERL